MNMALLLNFDGYISCVAADVRLVRTSGMQGM
jgi:hypothetical protein